MILSDNQKTCDHHFGENGESMECTKCQLHRDMARIVGMAIHRAIMRQKMGARFAGRITHPAGIG